MKDKRIILYMFALVMACSPAFAEEAAMKGMEHAKTAAAGTAKPEQKKAVETGKKAKGAKATPRKVTKEEEGKEAVCPVTGEKFKVTAETLSASYKDKVYYFCCPGCDKPFMANPEKYLNKKQAVQAKTYVCPMGDYQGEKPGKCPKCGMNLVEKK